MTLLEPRRKRVNFLKEVIRKANLANTQAYEGRAEDFSEKEGWRSAFDIVITRATWNIREFLLRATPFVSGDGILAAMKGKKAEELQSVTKDLETLKSYSQNRTSLHIALWKRKKKHICV